MDKNIIIKSPLSSYHAVFAQQQQQQQLMPNSISIPTPSITGMLQPQSHPMLFTSQQQQPTASPYAVTPATGPSVSELASLAAQQQYLLFTQQQQQYLQQQQQFVPRSQQQLQSPKHQLPSHSISTATVFFYLSFSAIFINP